MNLPDASYYLEGGRRIDYVLIVKLDTTYQEYRKMIYFIRSLEMYGVEFDMSYGIKTKVIFIHVHVPDDAVRHFAQIYGFEIGNQEDRYIREKSTSFCKFLGNPLNSDLFDGSQIEATNMERIIILNTALEKAKFGPEDNMYGLSKLLRMKIFKAAYPLHDGTEKWVDDKRDDQFLNDRQLLLKYWANFSIWYKEQPLDLLKKYFGTEIAFYFAWLGFYSAMLIPASVVGICIFLSSVIMLTTQNPNVVREVCTSNMIICPALCKRNGCTFQKLSTFCSSAKRNYLFDNEATIVFAIFMSFWATLFLKLWRRYENILRLRWNVDFEEMDTDWRLEYEDNTKYRRISKITGLLEPYVPARIRYGRLAVTVSITILIVGLILILNFGIIMMKIFVTQQMNRTFLKKESGNIMLVFGSIFSVIIMKFIGRYYGVVSLRLTNYENPRTQSDYDKSVLYKRYLLAFSNNYMSLFYMAFVKGRFFDTPGTQHTSSLVYSICPPSGCAGDLCFQLAFIMLFKAMVGNILVLIWPPIKKNICRRKPAIKITDKELPSWEKELGLLPTNRFLLTTEFSEMIIQYGFVTFFVATFPLAPLCALIKNLMEIRLDSFKLVTRFRRPIPRKVSGIGPWNGILQGITYFSTVTNAFVVAFTTNYIGQELYKAKVDPTLKGYVNYTLSEFDVQDYDFDVSQNISCYYNGQRHPPSHPQKYLLTVDHWRDLSWKFLAVLLFEYIIFILTGIVAYLIPEVPGEVLRRLNAKMDLQKKMKEKKTKIQ